VVKKDSATYLTIAMDSVPYLAVEVIGVVGVYVVVVTVAVLIYGFGLGAVVTDIGPRVQLAEEPIARVAGRAHTV